MIWYNTDVLGMSQRERTLKGDIYVPILFGGCREAMLCFSACYECEPLYYEQEVRLPF